MNIYTVANHPNWSRSALLGGVLRQHTQTLSQQNRNYSAKDCLIVHNIMHISIVRGAQTLRVHTAAVTPHVILVLQSAAVLHHIYVPMYVPRIETWKTGHVHSSYQI